MGGGDFKREDFVGTFKVEILFFFHPMAQIFFSIQRVKVSYVSYVTSILNNNKNLIRQSDS